MFIICRRGRERREYKRMNILVTRTNESTTKAKNIIIQN